MRIYQKEKDLQEGFKMLQSSNKIAYIGNLHAKGKNMFSKRQHNIKSRCQILHGFTLIERVPR